MIPPFTATGTLPEGVHPASWQEFYGRFGTNAFRLWLIDGIEAALAALELAGCRFVYVDGSFVTNEPYPRDWDACWEEDGVNLEMLDDVFFEFANGRIAQKAKYRGECFPASMAEGATKTTMLDFFQRDRTTGNAKGIVALRLRE